jgi:phosphoglycerol transferase MdoB-like AlkP superfamily enzyme
MHQYNFSRFTLYGISQPKGLSVRASVAALVLASMLAAVVLFVMQPNTVVLIWPLIVESNGLIFLLNWLPVLLVMLFLYFVTGNFIIACGVGFLVFAIPAFMNRYMIAMRHAPLTPFDFRLGFEFMGIAKSIRPLVYITAGLGLAFIIALMFVGFRFVLNRNPSIRVRILCAMGSLFVFFMLFFFVYGNRNIYENMPIEGSIYNETDQFQSKGFVYSFLFTWRTSRINKPEYFEQYKKIIEYNENRFYNGTIPESLPNIIMVLSEAFSELAYNETLNFNETNDPLNHYKSIKKESLHGYLVSPHIGGGTADIEFDIFTGINTRDFRGVPYSFTMVTRPETPGFTQVLREAGYKLTALHPGAGWFYNRQHVYPLLGFDAFIDQENFDKKDTKGGYITEKQTIESIIHHYENRDTSPYFLKAITIQNHGPYYKKYKDDGDELENYFVGLKDSDTGLKMLTDFLRTQPDPVILVYYGDHLPSLPLSVYENLIPEADEPGANLIRFNRVPFLIWANDAGRAYVDHEAFEAAMPDDRVVSSFYLGAMLLEVIGLHHFDPFMVYLNELRLKYPVSLENTYRHMNGPFTVFDANEAPELALYKSWAYYRIMGN